MENIGKKHIPVLYNELINSINIFQNKQNIIVDCTLGMAGHFLGIANKLNSGDIIIGFDTDSRNLTLAKKRIQNELKNVNFIENKEEINKEKINVILINSNFGNLTQELEKRKINKITGIYYDLGLSSLHLDEAERGFSFKQDGPLDMRFDLNLQKTAAQIVNSYTAKELREIFLKYGEEPGSNKIAHKIVEHRKKQKITTTLQLANIIPGPPKVKTRIFQAIRIEVNKELEVLQNSLTQAIKLLEKDGIIFVISFHSLEDRITKQILKKETRNCICNDLICSCHHKKSLKILSKKPILPTPEEIKQNPRARSAKARIAQKL